MLDLFCGHRDACREKAQVAQCEQLVAFVALVGADGLVEPTAHVFAVVFREPAVAIRVKRRVEVGVKLAIGAWELFANELSVEFIASVPVDDIAVQFVIRDRQTGIFRNWKDRKSTRLNSSHVANSYAGFCLNKK